MSRELGQDLGVPGALQLTQQPRHSAKLMTVPTLITAGHFLFNFKSSTSQEWPERVGTLPASDGKIKDFLAGPIAKIAWILFPLSRNRQQRANLSANCWLPKAAFNKE
jgi:hypothetical protein